MADFTLEELLKEKQRRAGMVTSDELTVLDLPEGQTEVPKEGTLDEFKKFAESSLKGAAKGIVDLVGGWGNLYDYLKKSGKEPSKLSSVGLVNSIKDLTGLDLNRIPGYKGAYEFTQAGAPATALTAAGMPGLFSRTAPGLAAEGAVAGGTSVLASTVAPDSPIAQFLLQSTPYAIGGGVKQIRGVHTTPKGLMPEGYSMEDLLSGKTLVGTGDIPRAGMSSAQSLQDLQRVGPLTPGQASGSPTQLAREAKIATDVEAARMAEEFKALQAEGVSNWFNNLLTRMGGTNKSDTTIAKTTIKAVDNAGKTLASNFRTASKADFDAAAKAGGKVDTSPVLAQAKKLLDSIPPEVPEGSALRTAAQRIVDLFEIPATPEKITPSVILGPTGRPATINITPATPASQIKISIDRLQKDLSGWGKAAWSGSADFGKGNIFEGIAPGQAKGWARQILNGYKEALDLAINNNVPGAAELKKARDSFSANLDRMNQFAELPIVKMFDVPEVTSLAPETVISKLSTLPPSQRLIATNLLQNHPQGQLVLDTVRRTQLEDILTKARKAAPKTEGAPSLDMDVLLKELSNKGDLNWMFPDTAEKGKALLAIKFLQTQTRSAAPLMDQGTSAQTATRALGGRMQAGAITAELQYYYDKIFKDPKLMAEVVFNPTTVNMLADAQKKGKLSKAADFLKEVGAVAARTAVRAGPRMGDNAVMTDEDVQQETPVDTNGFTLDELLQEKARRGQQ